MLAIGFPLAQVMPTEGDNPWIWLCGILAVALGTLFVKYDSAKDARCKRAEDQVDKTTATTQELVTAFRDLKEVILNDSSSARRT